jgi:uncharacterized protein YjdB
LTSITIAPPILSLANGTTEQIAATCNFSDGTTEDCTDEVSWTSGSNPTMQISDALGSQGLVTGLALGDTSITATINGVQATATISVMPAILTSITITPPNSSLADGTTVQAAATGNFSDGTTEDLTGEVSWTSSNNAIAQVSDAAQSKGLITGLAVGNTSIIATLNGFQGSAAITVTKAVLTSITITPPKVSLAIGTKSQLAATCVFSDSTTENCTTQVSWTSGNNKVAQVANTTSLKGLTLAQAVGSTSITATLTGVQGSAAVTVNPGKLTVITVAPFKSAFANGTSVQATATGKFSDGTTADLTNSVSWTSANNNFAQVSDAPTSKGLVFGVGVGDATIVATMSGIKGSTIFKVLPAAVSTITITPPALSIADGTARQLAATCNFTDGTTQDCTIGANWTSGNNSVAEMGYLTTNRGVVEGLSVGSTTVIATYRGIQGTAAITVTPAVVTSASITPPNPSITNGTTVQLYATANFSDRTTQDLTNLVSWTSSDDTIVEISDVPGSKGLVTATGVGTATITATLNGNQRSIIVTVTPAVLNSVLITPPNPSIADGATVQLRVIANLSDGTTQDLTAQVGWTSGNNAIAQVSNVPGSNGVVTGLAVGSASITATLNGKQSSTTITITPAILMSLTIDPVDPSIANGATVQATATGNFSDGSTADLTTQVGWTSGNESIAQVSDVPGTKGLIRALGVGNTSITATLNGVQGSTMLTVTPATLTALTITPPNPSVANGTFVQLRASGIFTDQSSEDLTNQVSWTSGNDATAHVSDVLGSKGLVTGLALGNTSIVVTLEGIQGSTNVVVTPAVLTGITISPADPTAVTAPTIADGTAEQFFATCSFSNNTDEDCTDDVSWTSSDNTIVQVSVDVDGKVVVTGVSVGVGSIIATINGMQVSFSLTVTPAILTAITVDPVNPSIAKGSGQQLNATCILSDSTTQNCTNEVSWTSSDNTISQVSNAPEDKGLATGVGAGNTTIIATLEGIQGTATISVTPPTLASVVVTPANPAIAAGTTLQMTAKGIFSDNSTQDLTQQAEFSTSDSNVIVADNILLTNGVMNAVAPGSATILSQSWRCCGFDRGYGECGDPDLDNDYTQRSHLYCEEERLGTANCNLQFQ